MKDHKEIYRNRNTMKVMLDLWNADIRKLKSRIQAVRNIEELDRRYGDILKGTSIK